MEIEQREYDDTDPLLPHDEAEGEEDDTLAHSELSGVDDADELLVSQLEDHGADLGLDVETGVEGGLDASALVDADDELSSRDDGRAEPMFDERFGDVSGIDGTGAEDGWTKDSEGDSELFQAEFEEDDVTEHRDDGGLEGVESARGTDDPLHEGLDETALPPLDTEEGDDALLDEIERELIRELGQGI